MTITEDDDDDDDEEYKGLQRCFTTLYNVLSPDCAQGVSGRPNPYHYLVPGRRNSVKE